MSNCRVQSVDKVSVQVDSPTSPTQQGWRQCLGRTTMPGMKVQSSSGLAQARRSVQQLRQEACMERIKVRMGAPAATLLFVFTSSVTSLYCSRFLFYFYCTVRRLWVSWHQTNKIITYLYNLFVYLFVSLFYLLCVYLLFIFCLPGGGGLESKHFIHGH